MSINAESTETHGVTASVSESAGGGPLASLGINTSLFFFQLFNFAVVAGIIWFLILKPLTKKLTERQKMIDESIDNSKKIQDNLKNSEQKYQEKIDQAKLEAVKLLEKSAADTEKITLEMKNKAKIDIENLVEQAKKNIASEREDMIREVKNAAGDLVISALEKILSEKINDKKDQELIGELVKKMK